MIWCVGIFVGGLAMVIGVATKRTRKVVWPAFWAPKGSEQRRIGWDEELPAIRVNIYVILVGLAMCAVSAVVGIIWALVSLVWG